MSRSRIVVGLSGGVDSSVAALLLKRAGHDVHGVFMDNWDAEDAFCTAAQDFQDARAVCARLDIPLHKVSFVDEYMERVFALFLAEYRAGRTPNPDVLCNSEIKFKAFLDHALRLDAEAIATGHYARLDPAGPRLLKARDHAKDQTYFLHAVAPAALARARLPVGELHKVEVRRLAREAGFPTHDKKDSTGICFIGERRFREFLKQYLPARPGPILSVDGVALGEHEGLVYYTLGQREGLKIGGVRGAGEAPWYVVDKRPRDDALIVAQGHDHPALLSDGLETGAVHWLGEPAAIGEPLHAKTRYRQPDQRCVVEALDSTRAVVRFASPQRAVTPGQYCVFYRGEDCLGGAVIERRFPVGGAPTHAVGRIAAEAAPT
jgi:tRNA-specific 2-thiouridylase